jgi:hypothetical protein
MPTAASTIVVATSFPGSHSADHWRHAMLGRVLSLDAAVHPDARFATTARIGPCHPTRGGLRRGRIAVLNEDVQRARSDADDEVVVAVKCRELRALKRLLSNEEDPARQMLGIALRVRTTDRELMPFVARRRLVPYRTDGRATVGASGRTRQSRERRGPPQA